MFLRFSKEDFDSSKMRNYRKCVFLGDAVVMEYKENIVGIAKLHEENDKCCDYDVIVAMNCELGADRIARYIKDMIVKSNNFTKNPSLKRRKYYVEKIDCKILPIKASIKFTRV